MVTSLDEMRGNLLGRPPPLFSLKFHSEFCGEDFLLYKKKKNKREREIERDRRSGATKRRNLITAATQLRNARRHRAREGSK